MRVYLDNAATTPLSPEVLSEMMPLMQDSYGNPSSIHAEGRKVRAALEKARKAVAKAIGASIGEIFFTSGGTESSNMAIKCAVRDLGVERIITSPIEHHCILHAVETVERFHQVEKVVLDLLPDGSVDYDQLEALLQQSNKKTLVSLMHANNEVGILLDLERVATLCTTHQALLHSDTVQTIGHFPIDVSKIPISFLVGAAHKFHGPKGVGFLYMNSNNIVKPFIDGGSQERNMRAGTENVYGIVGLAKALELATENMETRKAHISDLRTYLAQQLQANFEGVQINTPLNQPSLYTVLSVSFPPSAKSDLLLLSLDIEGISISGGSACSSGADAGSHVMQVIRGAADQYTTVRFSFSHYNTKAELDFVVTKLKKLLLPETNTVASLSEVG